MLCHRLIARIVGTMRLAHQGILTLLCSVLTRALDNGLALVPPSENFCII